MVLLPARSGSGRDKARYPQRSQYLTSRSTRMVLVVTSMLPAAVVGMGTLMIAPRHSITALHIINYNVAVLVLSLLILRSAAAATVRFIYIYICMYHHVGCSSPLLLLLLLILLLLLLLLPVASVIIHYVSRDICLYEDGWIYYKLLSSCWRAA
jgi:hypothetical protein